MTRIILFLATTIILISCGPSGSRTAKVKVILTPGLFKQLSVQDKVEAEFGSISIISIKSINHTGNLDIVTPGNIVSTIVAGQPTINTGDNSINFEITLPEKMNDNTIWIAAYKYDRNILQTHVQSTCNEFLAGIIGDIGPTTDTKNYAVDKPEPSTAYGFINNNSDNISIKISCQQIH
jgi:hypothetical protein